MVRRRIYDRLLSFPDNVRGAFWIVGGCVMFSTMATIVKILGDNFDSLQLAFFRAVFGFFFILPFVVKAGPKILQTKRPGLHMVRCTLGFVAMLCGFYAITNLSLADAVSISYARPLFLIPLAVIFLGEVVRVRRWSATSIGFIGVAIMLRPGGEVEVATFVALFGALLVAIITIILKKLTVSEKPETLLFYFGLISSLLALGPAIVFWRSPSNQELLLMMLLGACGASGQYCMIRGFKIGEATALMPFDYSRLIFAGIIGYVVFFEIPDIWTVTGGFIIVGSTLYIGMRESYLDKNKATDASTH